MEYCSQSYKGELKFEMDEQLDAGVPLSAAAESGSIAATRSRHYLDCVTPRHQGMYTCRGRTAHRMESATSRLYLAGGANDDELVSCERAKNTPLRPARVLQWRPKVLARMGNKARLICETEGFPQPEVTWSKNYRPLVADGVRVTVSSDGELCISELNWSDMGLYQCTAANTVSSDTVASFLYPFKP